MYVGGALLILFISSHLNSWHHWTQVFPGCPAPTPLISKLVKGRITVNNFKNCRQALELRVKKSELKY